MIRNLVTRNEKTYLISVQKSNLCLISCTKENSAPPLNFTLPKQLSHFFKVRKTPYPLKQVITHDVPAIRETTRNQFKQMLEILKQRNNPA